MDGLAESKLGKSAIEQLFNTKEESEEYYQTSLTILALLSKTEEGKTQITQNNLMTKVFSVINNFQGK